MSLLAAVQDPVIPKDFYTLKSMLTLTGATGVVFVVGNGLQKAFDYNPKWLALAISLVVCLVGVYFSDGHGSDYFVGTVNGFLVYATAAGTTNIVAGSNSGAAKGFNAGKPKRTFLTSWW